MLRCHYCCVKVPDSPMYLLEDNIIYFACRICFGTYNDSWWTTNPKPEEAEIAWEYAPRSDVSNQISCKICNKPLDSIEDTPLIPFYYCHNCYY